MASLLQPEPSTSKAKSGDCDPVVEIPSDSVPNPTTSLPSTTGKDEEDEGALSFEISSDEDFELFEPEPEPESKPEPLVAKEATVEKVGQTILSQHSQQVSVQNNNEEKKSAPSMTGFSFNNCSVNFHFHNP